MTDFSVRSWMTDPPPTIGPKENLRRARALLRSDNVQELLVVDESKLVGLLNEHDIWNHCPTGMLMLDEKQADELLEQIRVGGVMTLQPPTVTPDTPLREAIQLFAQSGRHGLPVVENGMLVGILTEERALQVIAAVLGEVERYTSMK
ncbi:MAG: CBS domain-containing protein [Deltaproteobacteria bacterium]|nr:CBS domain-containing protein [Deltaproteobacteria bacterium]